MLAPSRRQNILLPLAICAGLFFLYWLVASLTFLSDDELFLYDATQSFGLHQSLHVNLTADLDWPGHTQVEPFMPLVSAPLFLFAQIQQNIGNAHSTLLFNNLVSCAIALLFYIYCRGLGYSQRIATVATLLLGITTILFPYSKTFFREPLATLTLFWVSYCLYRWQQARQQWLWLLGASAGLMAGILTKDAALLALPVLALQLGLGFGKMQRGQVIRLLLGSIVVLGLASIAVWAYTQWGGAASSRYNLVPRLQSIIENLPAAMPGVIGSLFSPGKSLFLHSPLLILAFGAPFLAPRGQRLFYSLPLLLTAIFVVLYAAGRGAVWFGGTNWGPRYLVPLTPFLALCLLPILARPNRWLQAIIALLAAAGLLVQIGAVAIKVSTYHDFLNQTTGIVGISWNGAVWDWHYAAILGHWQLLLKGYAPDFAWWQADVTPNWLLAAGLAGSALCWLGLSLYLTFRPFGKLNPNQLGWLIGGLFLWVAVGNWLALRAVYADQRYFGQRAELQALRQTVEASSVPQPAIFLNSPHYRYFWLNYYKGNSRWYPLAFNPLDQWQSDQPLPAPNADPQAWLNPDAKTVVQDFSTPAQTLFFITNQSPYFTNSVRPLEWWLLRTRYFIAAQEFATDARLLTFASAIAPDADTPPAFTTDFNFESGIRLLGYDYAPTSQALRPGTLLRISTLWRAESSQTGDYKIGTYLINPNGTLALQNDSLPLQGFWHTNSWQAGETIRHNVAFMLPPDLAAGHYAIWTLLYDVNTGQRLSVSDASGTNIQDHLALFQVQVGR